MFSASKVNNESHEIDKGAVANGFEPHLKQMMRSELMIAQSAAPHWVKLSVTLLWTEMLGLKAVRKCLDRMFRSPYCCGYKST